MLFQCFLCEILPIDDSVNARVVCLDDLMKERKRVKKSRTCFYASAVT